MKFLKYEAKVIQIVREIAVLLTLPPLVETRCYGVGRRHFGTGHVDSAQILFIVVAGTCVVDKSFARNTKNNYQGGGIVEFGNV